MHWGLSSLVFSILHALSLLYRLMVKLCKVFNVCYYRLEQAEDCDKILHCNGDMVGNRIVSMDTGVQKTADLKSHELTLMDRRLVQNGDGKPLDRRKDERQPVNVEDEKYIF